MRKAALKLVHSEGTRIPSEADLLSIRVANQHEYELTDYETRKTRQRIYALNKENASFRWRTIREAPFLIVIKLRK